MCKLITCIYHNCLIVYCWFCVNIASVLTILFNTQFVRTFYVLKSKYLSLRYTDFLSPVRPNRLTSVIITCQLFSWISFIYVTITRTHTYTQKEIYVMLNSCHQTTKKYTVVVYFSPNRQIEDILKCLYFVFLFISLQVDILVKTKNRFLWFQEGALIPTWLFFRWGKSHYYRFYEKS